MTDAPPDDSTATPVRPDDTTTTATTARPEAGVCPVTGARARAVRGPRSFPLSNPVISTVAYAADPPGYSLRAQRDHGTVVRLPILPHNPTVQLSAPDGIRRVLQVNADNYARGAYYEAFELFMGRGLLTLEDRDWRAHRKAVNPAFTPQAIADRAGQSDEAIAALLDRWAAHARTGEPFDLFPEAMKLTCRVLGMALVGKDLSQDGGEFAEAVSVALEAIFKNVGSVDKAIPSFVPTPYRRRVARARRTLERVVAQAARDVDNGAGGEVATLIRAADLPDDALWSDLVTLFLAGVETTALALTWTLYEIARHGEVRDTLAEETDRVLGGRPPTAGDLDRLTYTAMVVDESLRAHPPVWQFTREAIEDDVLSGHHVPAGTPLLVSVYGAHHNPEQWDEPERFDPERFRPGGSPARDRSAYLPFGGGRRQCIGKRMGLALLQQTVAAVAGRFRISPAQGAVRGGAFITLFPKGGIRVTIQERAR
ncbi:cytochrome P450 [Streptomyces lichenis]|uniref:Cytochrome P450 n=1 Tax=Streptomyces lichenis TaxID=2306967 RepID=A0ABT0IF75_9ACTN|nr:cytochrome P450 [Streptomyces lichenis]MCK8679960.1 cytochrome P450 [Streptomyces lichenis]